MIKVLALIVKVLAIMIKENNSIMNTATIAYSGLGLNNIVTIVSAA